jgi:hypothetical protein
MTGEQQGILDPLIGYPGAKAIIRGALRGGDTHVALAGASGSGKSVVLTAIEENAPGVKYFDAKGLTERKLRDLISEDHQYLLLDEFDNADTETYDALNTALEQGRVTKAVHGDEYDVEIDTQVFVAMNTEDSTIPGAIEDRFVIVPFDEYGRSEFIEVCSILLPRQVEWVEQEETARDIARRVWDDTDARSPRKARDAARLARSPDRIKGIIRAMEDPKADVESEPLSPRELRAGGCGDSRSWRDRIPRDIPPDKEPLEVLDPKTVEEIAQVCSYNGEELTNEKLKQLLSP